MTDGSKTAEQIAAEQAERDRVAAETKRAQETAEGERLRNAREEQAKRDAEQEAQRDNVKVTPGVKAPEAVAEQHRQVDAAREKLNEQNREGHEKNMARIDAEAAEANARTAHADDPRAGHVPTGKQDNRNTPIVNKDGSKTWV